jgi:sulfur carrier protein
MVAAMRPLRLTLNGEPRELVFADAPAVAPTIDGLLTLLGLPRERVAVEHNGAIVVKAERAARPIEDGDVLEIVTLVGGG